MKNNKESSYISDINRIKKEVATAYKLQVFEIERKDRSRNLINARYTCYALAYKLLPKASLPSIAYDLFKQDHATCIHAVKKAHIYFEQDEKMRKIYERLLYKLQHRIINQYFNKLEEMRIVAFECYLNKEIDREELYDTFKLVRKLKKIKNGKIC